MYVSIDHVIAFAKTIVKNANDQDLNIWRDHIWYALLQLGVSEDEIDVAELIPKDYLAPLPPGLRSILSISLFDASGNKLPHKFRSGKQRIYEDSRLSVTSIGASTDINDSVPVDVSNDSYNIILGTNGKNVAKILIRYFKYPLDENNQPLIREDDVLACALFIKYMMALREDENQSKIQAAEMRWKQEADRQKAAKRVANMTPEKAKTLMYSLTRLIPNFNIDEF